MKIEAKTRDAIIESKLVAPGEYQFTVEKAEEMTSQFNNKNYINLTMKIIDISGKVHMIWEKLFEDDSEKLLDFCETTGLVDKYNSEELSPLDCIQKKGSLKLTRMEAKGQYKAKNIVKFLPNVVAPQGIVVDENLPY